MSLDQFLFLAALIVFAPQLEHNEAFIWGWIMIIAGLVYCAFGK